MSKILDKEPIIASYQVENLKKGIFFDLSLQNYYKKNINKSYKFKNKKIDYDENFNFCVNIYKKFFYEIVEQLNSYYKKN